MSAQDSTAPDLASTCFILPADAKVLPVAELSARARARIGAVAKDQSVVTRQGFRVTTRLVPRPLAELLGEFRTPSRLTDGVLRFARSQGQDPQAMLEAAFDALATLVEARLLLPEDAPEATAGGPSLVPGEAFAGFEIEAGVRSLDDSEVFRARSADGQLVALKIAREARPLMATVLAREASMLAELGGRDTPALVTAGEHGGRAYLAMSWCDGVSVGTAAQALRAARDRVRLHALVTALLQAYGRLHGQGLLHGDIHPGNCLVGEDGRIVILDFGQASPISAVPSAIDLARAGIPQFYDPQMAQAVLSGAPAPSASAASEQYAVAALAYLLLTGLHPIDSPAVQDELLRRIATRQALPFTTRGVPAWPPVEAVLQKALAHDPQQRFADVAAMAQAFAGTAATIESRSRAWPDPLVAGAPERALEDAVEVVRRLQTPTRHPRDWAWFALRAALALDDAELLAAADLLAARTGPDAEACFVRARLAQARSDARSEGRALAAFLAAARSLANGPPMGRALRLAAGLLEGASPRCAETADLTTWAARQLPPLMRAAGSQEAHTLAGSAAALQSVLALAKTGRVAVPAALDRRLRALRRDGGGTQQLWALAHDVFADDASLAQALQTRLPRSPLPRSFALLRRYQLTGDETWLADARRSVALTLKTELPLGTRALLLAEMRRPEAAVLPSFARLFGTPLG